MAAVTYNIDPAHSAAHFTVRHMMISNVRGEFTKVSGTVTHDYDNPASSHADIKIDVASLHTRDEQRDGHLKSADFLDAANFPTIEFVSTSVQPDGHHELLVKGNLTIHGVSREVVLHVEGPSDEVKDPWGNYRSGAAATAKISRKDFGLHWNMALETGGVLVGDEVKIDLEVELTRRAS
ncbi:MAG TPA: YceI family protein [Bryobacteraceae bacterium]|nr:YceI family protein [Bryobacteraceae bacterium]